MLSFSHMGKPFCIFRSMGVIPFYYCVYNEVDFPYEEYEIFPLRRNFFLSLCFFNPSTKI